MLTLFLSHLTIVKIELVKVKSLHKVSKGFGLKSCEVIVTQPPGGEDEGGGTYVVDVIVNSIKHQISPWFLI